MWLFHSRQQELRIFCHFIPLSTAPKKKRYFWRTSTEENNNNNNKELQSYSCLRNPSIRRISFALFTSLQTYYSEQYGDFHLLIHFLCLSLHVCLCVRKLMIDAKFSEKCSITTSFRRTKFIRCNLFSWCGTSFGFQSAPWLNKKSGEISIKANTISFICILSPYLSPTCTHYRCINQTEANAFSNRWSSSHSIPFRVDIFFLSLCKSTGWSLVSI